MTPDGPKRFNTASWRRYDSDELVGAFARQGWFLVGKWSFGPERPSLLARFQRGGRGGRGARRRRPAAADASPVHLQGQADLLAEPRPRPLPDERKCRGRPGAGAPELRHTGDTTARRTDRRPLESFGVVYCGQLNKRLVCFLFWFRNIEMVC